MMKEWFIARGFPLFGKSAAPSPSTSVFVTESLPESDRDNFSPQEQLLDEEAVRRDQLQREAVEIGKDVRELIGSIEKACRQTDPQFLRLGQELQEIFAAAMGLTDTIHETAGRLSQCEDGDSCLDRAGFLVENAGASLRGAQENIEGSLGHVRNLLVHLAKFTAICEMVTRIGLWFRVVGVNIEVECNVQNLSGDMFAGVSKEVNVLSKKINQMVSEIRYELAAAENRLDSLDQSSTISLEEMRGLAEKAEGIVRSSYEDIRQLLAETTALIDATTAKAGVINEKVGEVVVGIQFHDAMSQRIEHIVEALQDIETLCAESRTTEAAETLGSVCLILDFQKKQLLNLREEIRALLLTTQASFEVISGEVCDMSRDLAGCRLTGGGQSRGGANVFKPLQNGLHTLGGLLVTGNGMIDTLHQSAEETAAMADHLLEMIGGIKAIREETHIKAINTIIMATHLGSQGKTIEVLAKEIRALADQTGEMVEGVTVVQGDLSAGVAALRESISRERATISVADLDQGVEAMADSYRLVQAGVVTVTENTASLATRIDKVASELIFLEDLGAEMELSVSKLDQMLELLEPWRNSGQVHDENILRLLERYTMDQERLVHTISGGGQRPGASKNDDADIFFFDEGGSPDVELFGAEKKGKESAGTSFGDNVELF